MTELEPVAETKTQHIPYYNVILHNDDVTPFDLVMAILVRIFNYSESNAEEMTRKIEKTGEEIVGTYTQELAELKVSLSEQIAAKFDSPLRITMEKA